LTSVSASAAGARRQFGRVRVAALRNAALWLFVVCGATAIIEPSPYEFMFFVVLAAYACGGLTFEPTMAPLILWLALWNAGGLLALVPFTDDQRAVTFVGVSIYMAMTSIVVAALIADDPLPRIRIIRSGYALAGVMAAILGILGLFQRRRPRSAVHALRQRARLRSVQGPQCFRPVPRHPDRLDHSGPAPEKGA
jgi:hypothetical protein